MQKILKAMLQNKGVPLEAINGIMRAHTAKINEIALPTAKSREGNAIHTIAANFFYLKDEALKWARANNVSAPWVEKVQRMLK